MKRRPAAVFVVLALLLPMVAAGAPDFAALGIQRYDAPKAAPAFTLPDLDGRKVQLADLKGKVVLLFYWATWWPDCREELPSVNALYREFRDQGLEVLLIDFRESPEHVRKVVKDRGYVAPVLLDESGDVTGRVYGVWGPPTIYLVDRSGRLVGRGVGPRNWTTPAAKTFVRELLAQP
jgi:peroxiredoxin